MHHGILGMKWGVRRTPEELGHRVKEKESVFKNKLVRSSGSRSSNTLKEARSKDINKLTNEELKSYNNRLNLEKQFSELTSGRVKKGKDWASGAMKSLFGGIVIGSVTAVVAPIGQKWLKERFSL